MPAGTSLLYLEDMMSKIWEFQLFPPKDFLVTRVHLNVCLIQCSMAERWNGELFQLHFWQFEDLQEVLQSDPKCPLQSTFSKHESSTAKDQSNLKVKMFISISQYSIFLLKSTSLALMSLEIQNRRLSPGIIVVKPPFKAPNSQTNAPSSSPSLVSPILTPGLTWVATCFLDTKNAPRIGCRMPLFNSKRLVPIWPVMVLALHEMMTLEKVGMYAYSRSEWSIFHDLLYIYILYTPNHPIEVKFPSKRLMNGSLSALFHLKVSCCTTFKKMMAYAHLLQAPASWSMLQVPDAPLHSHTLVRCF